jgi:hypothetical protein
MGMLIRRKKYFTGKFFLHPLYLGHTMNLGKKIPRTIEKKFGVGVTAHTLLPKVI